MKMANHSKADWTDEERVQRMAKTYSARYDEKFWNAMGALVGSRTCEVVADFGCGPGLLLVDIANRYKAILAIGLDESNEMLAQAEIFLKERANLDSFELVQVNFDTDEIPLDSEIIDFGFSGFMLHEVANPTHFVSQVYQHITLNGFYVVYDFVSGNEEAFVKIVSQHGMSEENARKRYPHMCKHSANDIVEILSTGGFKDCRMIVMDEMRAIVVGLKR